MSNDFLKVPEWGVESVDRARVKMASYADSMMSLASVAVILSFYQRRASDVNEE